MQLTPRVIIGVVSFCLAMTGCFLANFFILAMIGEVNRKRQDRDLIPYLGFTLPKMFRVFSEYRSCYPDGKYHIYAWASLAILTAGMLTVAVCLHILG